MLYGRGCMVPSTQGGDGVVQVLPVVLDLSADAQLQAVVDVAKAIEEQAPLDGSWVLQYLRLVSSTSASILRESLAESAMMNLKARYENCYMWGVQVSKDGDGSRENGGKAKELEESQVSSWGVKDDGWRIRELHLG